MYNEETEEFILSCCSLQEYEEKVFAFANLFKRGLKGNWILNIVHKYKHSEGLREFWRIQKANYRRRKRLAIL